MATNTDPGRTRRESYSTPLTGASDLPAEPMDATSEMRSGQFIPSLIVDCTDDVGLKRSAFAADKGLGTGRGGLLADDAVSGDLHLNGGAGC